MTKYQGKTSPKPAALTGFKDAADVGDWAEEAMSWAIQDKIIQGDDLRYINPKNTTIRAEAAVMIKRFMEGPGR